MNTRGREDSPRVRQIPIQVERQQEEQPRYYQRSQQNDRQDSTSTNRPNVSVSQQTDADPTDMFGRYISGHPDARTNININNRPVPPNRQAQHPDRQQRHESPYDDSSSNADHQNSSNHQYRQQPPHRNNQNNRQKQPDQGEKISKAQHVQYQETSQPQGQQQNLRRNDSQESNSATAKPDEPIPMPPPPPAQDVEMTEDRPSEKEAASSTNANGMGQQQTSATHPNASNQTDARSNEPDGRTAVSSQVQLDNVKQEVVIYLQQITQFNGRDAKAKDARYLEEMLARCELALDNIECGNSNDLRQQRKAIIKLIEKGLDILERKIKLNSDTFELTQDMDNQLAKQLQRQEMQGPHG